MISPKILSTRVTSSLEEMTRENHTRKPLLYDHCLHSPEVRHTRMTYVAERSDFQPPPPRSPRYHRNEPSKQNTNKTPHKNITDHAPRSSFSIHPTSTYLHDSSRPQDHSSGKFYTHDYEMYHHPRYLDYYYHHQQQYTNWQGDYEHRKNIDAPPLMDSLPKSKTISDKVDHTYRDFSGISPSAEDLERYENKKKEYDRRAKKVGSPDKKTVVKTEDSNDKALKNRGRGNKVKESGEDAFIGFMGTNFPARLHDLLSHERGISDIITWLPHGRSWIVLDKKKFLEKVAPSHFQVSALWIFVKES